MYLYLSPGLTSVKYSNQNFFGKFASSVKDS